MRDSPEYSATPGSYQWASPVVPYKDATFFIATDDYVTYVAIVDRLGVIQPIPAPAATLANLAAREWINQFNEVQAIVNVVNEEAPVRRRGKSKKAEKKDLTTAEDSSAIDECSCE